MTVLEFLGALSDATRLRTLLLLLRDGPLCVCELVAALEISQPKISRHLAALRETGLVEDRRQANRIFYRLRPDLPAWMRTALVAIGDGADGEHLLAAEAVRLQAKLDRPDRILPAFGPRRLEEGSVT